MEGLCKEGVVIGESLRHVQKVSKALSVLFKVAFVLSCVSCIALIGLSAFALISEAQTPFLEVLLTTLPVILSRLAFVLVLWCLAGAFGDISKGSTPFSKKQIFRIRVIGALFLASAIAELLISANYSNIVQVGGDFAIGYSSSSNAAPDSLFIDARAILGAVVCFALSAIFSYGAILQEDNDGTV